MRPTPISNGVSKVTQIGTKATTKLTQSTLNTWQAREPLSDVATRKAIPKRRPNSHEQKRNNWRELTENGADCPREIAECQQLFRKSETSNFFAVRRGNQRLQQS